jgi:hypothetical protein
MAFERSRASVRIPRTTWSFCDACARRLRVERYTTRDNEKDDDGMFCRGRRARDVSVRAMLVRRRVWRWVRVRRRVRV